MDELFDVLALPGVRQPRAVNLEGEDIHCVVKLPGHPTFTTIRPKAPSGNPHQAKAPPIFGVPLGAPPPQAVRYQRVFQFTPQTITPYLDLTCPSLAHANGRLARMTGELLAVSAMAEGAMVGLAIAELQAGGQATLQSLMVQPNHRNKGIATRMLAQLQRFLAEQGACRLAARYRNNTAMTITLAPLLQRLGWSAPRTDFVLLKGNANKLSSTGWNTRFALAAPYAVFPWVQATAQDLSMAQQLGAPPELCPPTSPDDGTDHLISLGLRHSGSLVGWLIAHRLNAQTVRYSSLYVAPSHRAQARGLALLAEGFCRQQQAGIPHAKAAVAANNALFLRVVRRHLHPYLDGLGQSRYSSVALAAAE
jgi:GNAT superfamily N-acetyltransferase